ncbi:MAG: hypothetical protein ACTS73_03275 [Arsenophonus sp. NEOnobi-MAG3]
MNPADYFIRHIDMPGYTLTKKRFLEVFLKNKTGLIDGYAHF